jgi:hypothetical protein
MTDALRIGWTQAEAASRRRTYRCLLLVVLLVQVAAGLLALIWPVQLSDWLGLPVPSPDGWLRAVGVFLLITAVLYAPGYINPVFVRYPNVVGIVARFGLAILYLCLGGNFRWLAAYELIVAVALGVTYQRLIGAELMSRP